MAQANENRSPNTSEPSSKVNESLDPLDWKSFRTQAHEMLDDTFDYIQNIRERPVWQPIPKALRERFREALPRRPAELHSIYEEYLRDVMPYAAGNVHPGFMGWVHGGGTPVGVVAEMLAAGLNANLGGRDQSPVEVERQVLRWTRELFGFPESASGLFVTGASMANLIAIVIARDAALGFGVRQSGVATTTKKLTAYASSAAHACIGKGLDLCGLGSGTLRSIPTNTRQQIDVNALAQAIAADRRDGASPFLIVGTAGTVDTGAVDCLTALADIAHREKIWFHVDGALGALAILAPELAPKLVGLERADSLAFDFHKWGQVPYDAGYILVRDGALHHNAFSCAATYLHRADRGLGAGSPWPCDFGPDLSRGFRALKTWFTLKVYGTDALGSVISRTCELAKYLASRIAEAPELELLAPVELNVVCFRYRAEDADRVNERIVIDLQEAGIVAPSTTRVNGCTAIRVAIVNHRTARGDINALVESTLALGRAQRSGAQMPQAPPAQDPNTYAFLTTGLQNVEKQLAIEPHSISMLFLRANVLNQLGRKLEAVEAHNTLLALEGAHVGALNELGKALVKEGKKSEAQDCYRRAVNAAPEDVMSRVNLATLLIQEHQLQEAREHYGHALKLQPTLREAHVGMSFVQNELGNADLAAWHRRAAVQNQCLIPMRYHGEGPPIKVLTLASMAGGNTRFENFLSDRVFLKYLVAIEFYNASVSLPPHQLVVNAIGDADLAGRALAGAQSLLERSDAPVINPPKTVMATGRREIARRLSGVPGVITPRTALLPREELAAGDVHHFVAQYGFSFPLLVRTPGYHGGDHFLKVDCCEELPDALTKLPGRELMVIEYLDARGVDGKSRKYRVMMIDGQLYPLHAAISSDWKIHYATAEMSDYPEHRAEDAEFLKNMAEVLGPTAMAALQEIQNSLGLDYGGIDFGLNAQRQVLLFEANATMAVVPPGAGPRWEYRRPAVDTVYRAARKMLIDRACPQRALA